jgi:hypothetical protein
MATRRHVPLAWEQCLGQGDEVIVHLLRQVSSGDLFESWCPGTNSAAGFHCGRERSAIRGVLHVFSCGFLGSGCSSFRFFGSVSRILNSLFLNSGTE